jgi:hypothetical protein
MGELCDSLVADRRTYANLDQEQIGEGSVRCGWPVCYETYSSRVEALKWRLAGKKAKLNTLNSIIDIEIWEVL